MQKIIEKTERIAQAYLTGLGFESEQVLPLIAQARKDLETEFERLDKIRFASVPDMEALDRSLHALKGLLFNLGNHELAERLEAVRGEEPSAILRDLERILAEAAQ